MAIDGDTTSLNKSMETGVQDWDMTCGVCHVGGGQMEYDSGMNPYDPTSGSSDNNYYSFDRNQIVAGFMSDTNKAEIDCLMCHLNTSPTGANESGAGRAWFQTYGCGASNPIGPMNDPACQYVGPDPIFGLPGAGPFLPGTAYDPENRNIAIKTQSFQYAASLGIGAKVSSWGSFLAGGMDPTYKTITGITGVPQTISGAYIQGTPASQNCSACHARDDNATAYPGMLSQVRLGYGNMISLMPAGTALDVDQCTPAEVSAGNCPNPSKKNTVKWIEFGCKTGEGKRGQRIGQGPNDKWGMSMFNAMFGLGKNPGDPVTSETLTVTNPNMVGAGLTTVTTRERIPDADVHDVAGFQCATCHYAIGGKNITGAATMEGEFILSTNGSVTIPAATNLHGLNTAGGENTLSFGVSYPAETIYGIDHQFAQGDDLKDTYGKNNLDGTLSCESCHITRTHPRVVNGSLNPPVPTHAGFPALHMQYISCNTCHIPEIYVAPFRLKSRDWTLGYIKRGNETNGAFKNIYDWNFDLVTGSHTPITPLHQWATKYEKKQIVPVTPAEMPIWIALDNLGNPGFKDSGNSGSSDGVTPDDTSAIKTCTFGSRIFAFCNSDADCPGGKCVSGMTSYASPAKTRDVMAAAEAIDGSATTPGPLRRPNGGNINTGSLVPLFDGWPFPDGQGVDTKARIDAMINHGNATHNGDGTFSGGLALLKIFHAPFDLTHGITPKEWALGGSKRGGCVSCHSSKQPRLFDANGSDIGPNPNYSEYSVGFFEGSQHWMPEEMGVGKYDMLKNPFSFFADFDCTAIVNGLCSSDQMCMGMCMGMMHNSSSNCQQFCGGVTAFGQCGTGTGPGGSFTDNDLFNPMSGDPSNNWVLQQCIGFMQPNFDLAMGWPNGTARAMGLLDGVNGLQGFMLRETVDGTTLGCNPIVGPKNVAIINMGGGQMDTPEHQAQTIAQGTQTVAMMGNLNSCMPAAFGGTCTGAATVPGYPATCVGGFRNGKGCIPMDLGFGADADCAGTLDPSEAAHSPYGLMLSRGEVRARFDLHLQQSSKVVPGPSALSNDDINRVWWPMLTEQNPGNTNHLWAWDQAGAPNVCGAFQNEPCCTNMYGMPASCSDGMNVRTTIHANQLLGFAPATLVSLMNPVTAGVLAPSAGFTWTADGTVDYKVNFQAADCSTCTYAWNLGDGATTNVTSFSHTYANSTARQVTLTVFDTVNGLSSVSTQTVLPKYLAATPTSVTLSATASGFTVSGTYSVSGGIAPYTVTGKWGDGTVSSVSGGTFSHTYVSAGTYTVTITAIDSGDNGSYKTTGSASQSVTITSPTISGKVTRLDGTTPLSGALVVIKGPVSFVQITKTDGTYSQTGLKPGTYTVTVTKSGYTFPTSPASGVAPGSVVNFSSSL